MEEGAMSTKRPLLSKEQLGENGESSERGFGGELPSENSSPITFMLVFSTFIAVCGSYSVGAAVSVISKPLTFISLFDA